MKEQHFVYPQHPNFEPYRQLAESTELQIVRGAATRMTAWSSRYPTPEVRYERVAVPFQLAFYGYDFNEQTAPQWTREEGVQSRSFWDGNAGLDSLSVVKSWPAGYVNNGIKLTRGGNTTGDLPQANEIIAFGVGALRPFKVEGLGLSKIYPETVRRVDSGKRRKLATYIADISSLRGDAYVRVPHALESTNLVMPETLGELYQLSSRRDEKNFTAAYLRDLRLTTTPAMPGGSSELQPLWQTACLAHLRSGQWQQPPADVSELLDRVDQLLETIYIDEHPLEITSRSERRLRATS